MQNDARAAANELSERAAAAHAEADRLEDNAEPDEETGSRSYASADARAEANELTAAANEAHARADEEEARSASDEAVAVEPAGVEDEDDL